jgi:Mn2+/Fe2+ NRAMP family transporter
MLLFLATILGLVVWIVMFFIGAKALESFLITLLIVLLAATWQVLSPYLPGHRGTRED